MIEYSVEEDEKKFREFTSIDRLEKRVSELLRKHPELKELRARKVGRNEICPCGSGKKFKKCCLMLVGCESQPIDAFAESMN